LSFSRGGTMCTLVSPLDRERGNFCCKEETCSKMFGQITKTEKWQFQVSKDITYQIYKYVKGWRDASNSDHFLPECTSYVINRFYKMDYKYRQLQCIKGRPPDRVQQKFVYLVNYADYAIFSSTIWAWLYQDSEKENHFCAALMMIVVKISNYELKITLPYLDLPTCLMPQQWDFQKSFPNIVRMVEKYWENNKTTFYSLWPTRTT